MICKGDLKTEMGRKERQDHAYLDLNETADLESQLFVSKLLSALMVDIVASYNTGSFSTDTDLILERTKWH